MAVEILLPRLGWTMEEGVFVEWLKQDGDLIQSGDMLFTVEGDKATVDVETFESGVLRLPPDGPQPGSTLPVGALLGYLVQPGEAAPFESVGSRQSAVGSPETVGSQQLADAQRQQGRGAGPAPISQQDAAPFAVGSPSSVVGHQSSVNNGQRKVAISPRARRVAGELGIDWAALIGSGRTGRIVERDVRASALARPATVDVRVTPVARRVAEQLGVDLAQLAASQPGRKIERADVEEAARLKAPPSVVPPVPAPAPAPSAPAPVPVQGTPMSGVRRIIATRMAESAHTAAPVTLTTEADATELAQLRKRISADLAGTDLRAPSYTDLVTRLVALALLEHPALNATLSDDTIIQHTAVHIGIAVDSARGLLVPVIREAHSKSVQTIATESARLIGQVRDGKAAPDDLRGGTFTITNLGMYEIDAFTPIINLPECAILGLGRIIARPVVVDEEAETVAVRKMIALSLTFDHRLVDGAPAARFLQRVKYLIEHPYAWLTR